ncbi:kinetochore-associated Ndc80 complex subunit spc24 [Podila humilis]|nr:kinetochore-associated Ndc80 complex subunit spc24 [Podila humilis]
MATTAPEKDDILSLIQEVGSQFQRSGSDTQGIQKMIQDLTQTETLRNEMVQDARSLLQNLARSVQQTRAKGTRNNADTESENHDDFMISMDQKKYAVARSIRDLDESITTFEAEIHQLRMESLALDSSRGPGINGGSDDEDDDDNANDVTEDMCALRLQLFRGLGIEMQESDLGMHSKARIRSHNKTDVHIVNFDGQLSPYFQTNLIWKFAS